MAVFEVIQSGNPQQNYFEDWPNFCKVIERNEAKCSVAANKTTLLQVEVVS